VVYADNDPVVVSHGQALLASSRTAAIHGDLTRSEEILDAADVRRLIDFARPVAILLVAVLHFVPDEAGAAENVARLRDVMAPGSCLVISHVTMAPDHVAGGRLSETARELGEARKGMSRAASRNREEVAAFFGDMTLVDPGLTEAWSWRPDGDQVVTGSEVMTVLAGLARKD
jgi:hypothetical protein